MPCVSAQNQINQAVQNLISNGHLAVPMPALLNGNGVKNVYPIMRRHFNDKAAKALHVKVHGLIHQRNEIIGHEGIADLLAKLEVRSAQKAKDDGKVGYKRVIDVVMFFGSTCSTYNLHLGIEKTIAAINDLADKGYVTGAMMPLGIITLHESTPEDGRYIVASYVAITQDGQAYLKTNHMNMQFPEGGIPKKVGEQ